MTRRPWITDAASRVRTGDLTDRATITRETGDAETVDPVTYELTRPAATIGALVPCLVSASRPRRDIDHGDNGDAEADHRIRLPIDAAVVQPGDTITITVSENPDLVGVSFDVLGPTETSIRVTRQVWARRRNPDPTR